MFLQFFANLRQAHVPVTPREYLDLMRALEGDLADMSVDEFYRLSRALLVKDERNLDKFDVVFAATFKGVLSLAAAVEAKELPEEWLRRMAEKYLSPEERAEIEKLGFDKLMETLRQRLAEQKGRHQGGSKWIGTGGTSPFGAYGDHPEGVRIGQDKGRRGSAVKVWDKREFKDFDGDAELGPRNIKLALRRLRRFAREGAAEELDLDGTIRSTADKGYIDVMLRPERRNAVKVLLFLDVGGSMDWHVEAAEQLFSAAKSQFKRLEHFYFHNCLYESVWKNNRRRHEERIADARPPQFLRPRLSRRLRRRRLDEPVRDRRPRAARSSISIPSPGGSGSSGRFAAWPRTVWINPTPPEPVGLFAVDDDDRRDFPASHVPADARRRRGGDAGAGRLVAPSRERRLGVGAASLSDHQHRTLRVAHDRLGVRAEQIVGHHRTMRADDDEVGAPLGGLLQEFVIDAARPRRGALALGRQIDAGENGVELRLGPLLLLLVEIGRHIFHEGRRNDRLDIDQPAARRRPLSPVRAPAGVPSGPTSDSARSTARTMRLYMTTLPAGPPAR